MRFVPLRSTNGSARLKTARARGVPIVTAAEFIAAFEAFEAFEAFAEWRGPAV